MQLQQYPLLLGVHFFITLPLSYLNNIVIESYLTFLFYSSSPTLEIEPLRTLLKSVSPDSARQLHNENSNQYRALYWLYYDMVKYDTYTDEERVQLWALGLFYYDTLGSQWYFNTNWMSDNGTITVCSWYGLTCDENGMVIEISLANNRLRRDLPYELQLLSRLQYIGLSDNLFGTFPLALFEMPNLEVIDFDGNGITEIPRNIPEGSPVKELYLANNDIWKIPRSITLLEKLQVLWLYGNALESTLPSFISELKYLGKENVFFVNAF